MKFPKPTKIRSKAITKSAHGMPCMLRIAPTCSSRETVVFCHAPSAGKGIATKSDDFWGCFGCSECHRLADSGLASDGDWLRAIYQTQKLLIDNGLIEVKQ